MYLPIMTLPNPSTVHAQRVAALRLANYLLRTTFLTGNVFLLPGMEALAPCTQKRLCDAVKRAGRDCGPGVQDDTRGGHVTIDGLTVSWRFCYYAADLQHPSPDPVNPYCTRRVMMLQLVTKRRARR